MIYARITANPKRHIMVTNLLPDPINFELPEEISKYLLPPSMPQESGEVTNRKSKNRRTCT